MNQELKILIREELEALNINNFEILIEMIFKVFFNEETESINGYKIFFLFLLEKKNTINKIRKKFITEVRIF